MSQPAAAELIVELVNTLDVSTGEDALGRVAGLEAFLQTVGLPSSRANDADRQLTIELREQLRATLLAHHDGGDDIEALAALERITRRMPLQLRFVDGQARLAASGTGAAEALVAAVANAVVELQHDGRWYRVRICPAADCAEAFDDQSRAGTRRWCSMEVCGNRAKVGSYRRRRPATSADATQA